MTILHTEQDGGLTITIGQEWDGAGLFWELSAEHPILGKYRHRSTGRFYTDQHGEIIHGKTIADVIAYATNCAKRFSR